jgi:hypothetical protein
MPSLGDRLRPSALIGYLGLAVVVMAVVFGALLLLLSLGPTENPVHAVYSALLHVIDPER